MYQHRLSLTHFMITMRDANGSVEYLGRPITSGATVDAEEREDSDDPAAAASSCLSAPCNSGSSGVDEELPFPAVASSAARWIWDRKQ